MKKRTANKTKSAGSLFEGGKSMAANIAQQAVRQFYDQGFKATTVRDIAQACEITPGAIYNHFKSKEELLYRIVQSGHEVIERMMFEALASAKPEPEDQLRQLIKALIRFHTLYRYQALVSNDEIKFLAPELLEQIVASRKRHLTMFSKILRDGEASGVFRIPRVNGKDTIPFVTIAFMAMCVRVANWFKPEGVLTSEEAATLMAEVVLNAFRAR